MTKPKPKNLWRKRAEEAEKNVDYWQKKFMSEELRADEEISERMKYQGQLASRPTIEKIVEKEVPILLTPYSMWIALGFVFLAWFLTIAYIYRDLKKLQQPILQPYAVTITKIVPDPNLTVCNDIRQRAWKALKHHHNAQAFEILDEEAQ